MTVFFKNLKTPLKPSCGFALANFEWGGGGKMYFLQDVINFFSTSPILIPVVLTQFPDFLGVKFRKRTQYDLPNKVQNNILYNVMPTIGSFLCSF